MKRNIITLMIASILALTSCGEDFLYKAPQGSIDQDALTNEQGMELLVINAYSNLNPRIGYAAGLNNWAWGGMYGGDANKGSDSNDQSVANSIETYSLVASNGYLLHSWRFTGYGVKRANLAMTVINDSDISEELKANRLTEMRFLRAIYYFEGVRIFGPTAIPYIDETMAAEENDPKVHNGTDIYPNILADVEAAIAGLPDIQTELGRPNKTAARALKAKILMHQGKTAEASPILEDIINNGLSPKGERLALQADLSANFNALTEHGIESIFDIEASVGANDNANYSMMLNFPHSSGPGGCCGFYQPSAELANSFQVDANGLPYLNGEYRTNGVFVSTLESDYTYTAKKNTTVAVDPRLDFAIGRFEVPYKDYGLPANDWVRYAPNGGIYMPKKHVYSQEEADAGLGRGGANGGWAPGSAMNAQYLNLRDCILLYAECLAEANDLAGAMAQVNKIRARAANPENLIYMADGTLAANYVINEYPSSHAAFSSKDVCIKAIRMERKLELAMEGNRWFDLSRWGGDYMNQELTAYLTYEVRHLPKFASKKAPDAARTMLPIPETQIATAGTDESGNDYLTQTAAWQ